MRWPKGFAGVIFVYVEWLRIHGQGAEQYVIHLVTVRPRLADMLADLGHRNIWVIYFPFVQ
jgi:hypothetical protein